MRPDERTADEKLLAVLAIVPAPVERAQLARALGWCKQRVAQVLLRLLHDEKVTVIPGTGIASRGKGRPPALFWLAGRAIPAEIGKPRWPWFDPDTVVLTPRGREARVIQMLAGGFVDVVYLDDNSPGTLHASLLRPFQADRERPPPVRVLA